MNSRAVCPLVFSIMVSLPGVCARAVVIREKGSREPTRGYLVDQNEQHVKVNILETDGRTRERVILRSAIEDMTQAVAPERLAALRPEKPSEYRDYADELAKKREDPEAHLTALRLYLIAAYLRPQELGRSSLLCMAALARCPAEERRFRAAAYLLDRSHDPLLLSGPSRPLPLCETCTEEERRQLLTLLMLLRNRNGEARAILSRHGIIEPLVVRLSPWLRADEIQAAANSTAPLSPDLLRRIVSVEVMLLNASPPRFRATADETPSWSSILVVGSAAPVGPLALETLTEFDPRQQWFRDGRWVENGPGTEKTK